MKLDPEFEASFMRIIGLLGFILATVAFFLIMSGMTEFYGQDASSVMFMAFIMCTALAFAGLLVSAMAGIHKTLTNVEKLLKQQNKILENKSSGKKSKTTKKKAAKKKAA